MILLESLTFPLSTYNSLQIFPQEKMNKYQNMCGLYLTYIDVYLKYVILTLHYDIVC